MSPRAIFSNTSQLELLADVLSKYARLPFSSDSIPGSVLEHVLSHVRGGTVLRTYDFVDVIKRDAQCGWQVKSTKADTPVTWKRAKLPDSRSLIVSSEKSDEACQFLGNALIDFCNKHAAESLKRYELKEIGLSRLIVFPNRTVTYYEKLICTRKAPLIFDPQAFTWNWSKQKKTVKKEQLSALHGYHRKTGDRWFAWHGRGENQLHFTGERKAWWPAPRDRHVATFTFPAPTDKLTIAGFVDLLGRLDVST